MPECEAPKACGEGLHSLDDRTISYDGWCATGFIAIYLREGRHSTVGGGERQQEVFIGVGIDNQRRQRVDCMDGIDDPWVSQMWRFNKE